jgi:hypothetical protein
MERIANPIEGKKPSCEVKTAKPANNNLQSALHSGGPCEEKGHRDHQEQSGVDRVRQRLRGVQHGKKKQCASPGLLPLRAVQKLA